MECGEAKGYLADLDRGRLESTIDEAVRSHVEQCAGCSADLQTEADLHALIRAQAPRYPAPPGLRTRIEARLARPVPRRWSGWRDWFRVHVWATSGLAGAMAVALLVWAGTTWFSRDPLSRVMLIAVNEHAEYVKDLMNRPVPDAQVLVGKLRSQAGFALYSVFPGDSEVQLVGSMMSDLSGKRAATLVYRDAAGQYTTLFLMPAAGTVIPEGDRMQIETFKPHHRVTSGRQVLLWKQQDLACLIISDLDQSKLAGMFLKIRKAA